MTVILREIKWNGKLPSQALSRFAIREMFSQSSQDVVKQDGVGRSTISGRHRKVRVRRQS